MRLSLAPAAVLLLGLVPARADAREADEHVILSPTLRASLDEAVAALAPVTLEPLPAFSAGVRAATEHFDVSTTYDDAELRRLLQLAEESRVILQTWLHRDSTSPLQSKTIPVVFCSAAERDVWLRSLHLAAKDLEWNRKLGWNYERGLHVVVYEPRLSSAARVAANDIAISAFAQDLLNDAYPLLPPWCREGTRYMVTAILNDSVVSHIVSRADYDRGARTYQATAPMHLPTAAGAFLFNPVYLSMEIERHGDEDLRLLMGKGYDILTADDDVKAFFLIRWVVESTARDPLRLAAWFDAMALKEGAEEESGRVFERKEKTRVYEALDSEFREYHKRTYPLPIYLATDWTGEWAPSKDSLREYNVDGKKFRHEEPVSAWKLDLRKDGTWEESMETVGTKRPSTSSGTWEADASGIHLHASVLGSRSNEVAVRTLAYEGAHLRERLVVFVGRR